MPIYQYTALNSEARESKGRLDASSEKDAIQVLRGQGLFVVNIAEAKGSDIGEIDGGWAGLWSRIRPSQFLRTKDTHRIFLFRQLALMLRSGHTIVQSLDICAELVDRRRLVTALRRMSQEIQNGSSFSDALRKEKIFKPITASLVASGEVTGEIDSILERLASNMETSLDRKRQLLIAMFYPGIVLLVSLLVVYFLLAKVIPDFAGFFAARGNDLPGMMLFLLDLSDWMVDYGGYLGGTLGTTTFLILAAYTTEWGKAIIDRWLLAIPFVGASIIYSSIAQMGVTMGMLLKSGLTVLEALRVLKEVMSNQVFVECVEAASEDILAGQHIAVALKRKPMPKLVTHMVAVGEQSGELDTVMETLGDYFGKQLENAAKTVVAFIEPALILFVGGVVFVVYFSIFQAVFQAAAGG
ncbi:MAG: type II secretion system F family protein [Sneathiellales bacterium]|nr:type II secretion system F family protein [Sneathiellales bacterium]